ncbi:MAG: efflux RND transporter periplasmic adaptor subunit [Bacteroidota bacterium]
MNNQETNKGMKSIKNNLKSIFLVRSIILTAVLALLSFGLNSCSENADKSPDEIKERITEKNNSINELTKEIAELERELESMGAVSNNRTRIPVTVSKLEQQHFDHYVKLNGSVEAVKSATITPEISGHIKIINVDKGDKVKKGTVVARLNSEVIENNIKEVKTSMELAETMYNRQKSLWEQEIGSEIEYLQAKNNYESLVSKLKTLESQLEMSVIKAPFDGIIENTFQKQGELATPGAPMMQIINLEALYINADVSERYLPVMNQNKEVILRFPSYPEYEEKVAVNRIGNVINPDNRTFNIQLKINNQEGKFKPNMTAIVSLMTFSTDEAVIAPSFLIKQDTQGHYVFIAKKINEDLRAKKVYLERGLDGEGQTIIESGISAGDLLIIKGHNQVNDGSLLSISDTNQS